MIQINSDKDAMKHCIQWVIYFCLSLVILSLWGFYEAIRPFRIRSTLTPQTLQLNYENVTFRTSDNIMLSGWFIPSTNPRAKTIIILHGYPADKGDVLPAMAFLHSSYNLLFFDFRYFGKSEGNFTTIGKREVLDLLAAIQFLHHKGIHEVGVWGFSMGGAVAIMTAPQAPEIKAIVAESSYANLDLMVEHYYRLPVVRYPLAWLTRLWARIFLGYDLKIISPAKAAQQIHIPIMIIHSKQDDIIPFEHALLLQQALSKNTKAKFLFIDNAWHGQRRADFNPLISAFFK